MFFLIFVRPGGSDGKASVYNVGDLGSIPGWGTHSSILAWKIPWTEEPGRLQSMGLQRVGHDWSDLAAAAATMWETRVLSLGGKIPWRRKWQPTPVFLPGKFHGWKSLVGYSPWGCKESDTTEQLHLHSKYWLASLYIHIFPIITYIYAAKLYL